MKRFHLTFVLHLMFFSMTNLVAAGDKPHAVVVVGTHHYAPQVTMPKLAAELGRLGMRTTVINPEWDPEKDDRGLPGLEALETADVAIFFVRFLSIGEEQLQHIRKFVEGGKPVVCLRTSTHAFKYEEGHEHHRLNASFGREVFGTPYLIHLQGATAVNLVEGAGEHPILTGVADLDGWSSPGTLYLTKLEPGAKGLLQGTGRPKKPGTRTNQFGTHELKPEMTDTIAWTWENRWGGRVFGTSLGHAGDFADPRSMRVLVNGVFWAAGHAVPSAETPIETFRAGGVKRKRAAGNETGAAKAASRSTSD